MVQLSIFDEGEGQEPFTTEGLSYTIEDETSGYRIIIDGVLHYFFYENNSYRVPFLTIQIMENLMRVAL